MKTASFLTGAIGSLSVFFIRLVFYVRAERLDPEALFLFFAPPLGALAGAGIILKFPRIGGIIVAIATLWFGSLFDLHWMVFGKSSFFSEVVPGFVGAILFGPAAVVPLWVSALLAFDIGSWKERAMGIFSSISGLFGSIMGCNMGFLVAAMASVMSSSVEPLALLFFLTLPVVAFVGAGVVLIKPLAGGATTAISSVGIAYTFFDFGVLSLVVLVPLWVGAVLAFLEHRRLARHRMVS